MCIVSTALFFLRYYAILSYTELFTDMFAYICVHNLNNNNNNNNKHK